MKIQRLPLLTGMILALFSNAFLNAQDSETLKKPAQTPHVHQKKIDSSAKGDWIQLFNGKDLTGWTPKIRGHELGVNYGDTFRVKDGILAVSYDQYKPDDFLSMDGKKEPSWEKYGHLFYKDSFSHYLLRVEYRFVGNQVTNGPGWAFRNNGLMIHGQDPAKMAINQKFPVSIEVQLLGGGGTGERSNLNLCTPGTNVVLNGKLFKKHCTTSSSKTFHGDQWVTAEIEVRGNKVIRHKIDGQTVLEYTAAVRSKIQSPRCQTIHRRWRPDDPWRNHFAAIRKSSNRVPKDRVVGA